MTKRLSARAQSQLRFGNALGLLATGLLILYGLYIGIRLPWIASGFAHNPSDAVDAYTSYLEISGALLLAAYVALGGWLFFLCLAMWREKTVSRYLTLLGMSSAPSSSSSPSSPIRSLSYLVNSAALFGRSAWDSGCCDQQGGAEACHCKRDGARGRSYRRR